MLATTNQLVREIERALSAAPSPIRSTPYEAELIGRNWKHTLATNYWPEANVDPKQGLAHPELHFLRNTHGPSWLARFKLPA
jgi:hypothetical protein